MPLKSLLSSETKLVTRDVIPARTGALTTMVNGRLVTYDDNKETYLTKGYGSNDNVYSILNLVMDKIRVAPWKVYEIKDQKAYSQLNALYKKKAWTPGDGNKAISLHAKALSAVEDGGALGELLRKPNDEDTFSDFVANASGFRMLTGDAYIWANKLTSGAEVGIPTELILLPPQYVNIYATDAFPSRVTGYELSFIKGDKGKYKPDEVMHIKYWNPDYAINGVNHYGFSPLRAALGLLNRDNSSMKATTAGFQNEGVKGILTLDHKISEGATEEAVEEVNRLAQVMRTSWSGEGNRGKIGIGGYSMEWHEIGLSPEQMQALETDKANMRRLCTLWGVQSQLLNDPDNKVYSNAEEAEASLTTRAAIPQLTTFRDAFNSRMGGDFGGTRNRIIDFDISVYSELQVDIKDTVEWAVKLMQFGWPLNRALEAIGYEVMPEPVYNEGRITPQMGQTVSENALNDVDNALNQADEPDEDAI